jgi:hypothetical protein
VTIKIRQRAAGELMVNAKMTEGGGVHQEVRRPDPAQAMTRTT